MLVISYYGPKIERIGEIRVYDSIPPCLIIMIHIFVMPLQVLIATKK